MTDRIANALKRFGARRVTVKQDDEDPAYFYAEMNALHPLDRHEIARAVCHKLGLTDVGGGTMLALGSQKARSDVSFRVIKRRNKGKGKGKGKSR